MSLDIRLPKITEPTDSGKLQQIQTYLFQLVEQLNWALNNIGDSVLPVQTGNTAYPAAQETDNDAVSNFNSIKGLIIKSADIVNAYYQEINKLIELSGEYVAEATFPEGAAKFVQSTTSSINASSESIVQLFTNIQNINTSIESLQNMQIDAKAYIESGLLGYDEKGYPIYGLEIGQRNNKDGVEVFNKFARFTANMLAFYDANNEDTPVAYISNSKLYITQVEITGGLRVGGFADTVMSDRSVVTKWVGGD